MPVDITEYAFLARDGANQTIPAGQEPQLANHQITPSALSQQTAAFAGGATLVRVHTDEAIRIEIGGDPTAASTSKRMAANTTEFFGVRGGQKAAVVSTT